MRDCHPGAGPPSPIPCLPLSSSAPHPQCPWGTWVGCLSHLWGLQGMRELGVWERSQTHLFVHSFLLYFFSIFAAQHCLVMGTSKVNKTVFS